MPSKDNTSGVTAGVDSNSDVEDLLVAAIQQKLRLKTRSCHHVMKQNRTSPYKVPMRTTHDIMTPTKRCRQCYADLTPISPSADHMCRICSLKTGPKTANTTNRTTTTTDPYDLLQELLREGTLIQEAVKRLQLGLPANRSSTKFHYEDYDDISSTASSTTPYEF